MRLRLLGYLAAVCLVLPCTTSRAELTYPTRPIRLLVGFAAGGPTDNAARVLAGSLGDALGQQIIVENRAGANSQVAALELIKSKPDGYTLMLASNGTLAIAPVMMSDVPYQVARDFVPIGSVAGYPHVIVVPRSSEIKNFPDLISYANRNPNSLNVASVGHVNDLTIKWIESAANIKVTRIVYKGDTAVVSDLVANRIDVALLAPSVVEPLVQSGKITAIALTGPDSLEMLAGVLPLKHVGSMGVDVEIWNGLVAPAGTEPEIVLKLSAALDKALVSTRLQEKLALNGFHVIRDSPDSFKKKIEIETNQWRLLAKESNLKTD